MRSVIDEQKKLGENIGDIKFDLKSRDEIPQLLIGLQYIYTTSGVREDVFSILKNMISKNINTEVGRPGMNLWKILVLGTLRLNCNWDYDKVHEIANQHQTVRLMLGHGIVDQNKWYTLQRIKDNVRLFTEEILKEINVIVVKAGHKILLHGENEDLKARADSFVVETDVHYPTDINLLFDAIRKVVMMIAFICTFYGITKWRQYKDIIRKIKGMFRKSQKLKKSTSKNEEKKKQREKMIKTAHEEYINFVEVIMKKVNEHLNSLPEEEILIKVSSGKTIIEYMAHVERQIDQIRRRVIKGETIPHNEKVFSIFQEHTEWISKGKAGVPVELGLRVCIIEDKYGFILNHQVMEKVTDDKLTVPIIIETKSLFENLKSCSYDKGFWSPSNKENLEEILDFVVLPKKGKLSKKEKEFETMDEFVERRHKHSAVESGINALENHGLDRCLDHGIDGFKSYVALAVLARNIQKLGKIILNKNRTSGRIRETKKKCA